MAVLQEAIDAVAEHGTANNAARALGVPPSTISIVSGLQGRAKIAEITGLARAEIQSRLALALTSAS